MDNAAFLGYNRTKGGGEMDIGAKLKERRGAVGLSQEAVAEHLGVSRQTISNWENDKFYPDIVSVIRLSDLYGISLDELLKGDGKMLQYLADSTDTVKSRQRLARLIPVAAYLVIWVVCVAVFWLDGQTDAMGYSLLVFWLILPLTTFVLSVFVGRDEAWQDLRWLMLLFFGLMYMLADFATFDLANAVAFDKVNWPELAQMLPGILCAAAGVGIGALARRIGKKKNEK